MLKIQHDVHAFHESLGLGIGDSPAIRNPNLRTRLIAEETTELLQAIAQRDLPAIVKEACDVLYVVVGTFVEFGIDLEPFWDEVHRSNMAKNGGPIRADGKQLKPDGWEKPDIAGLLKGAGKYPPEDSPW